jgi:hypothetical protein
MFLRVFESHDTDVTCSVTGCAIASSYKLTASPKFIAHGYLTIDRCKCQVEPPVAQAMTDNEFTGGREAV